MQNIVKNKFMTTFLSFMFVLVGALFVGTPKVHAKLNDNAFLGVTANFNANAIESFVINVNEDNYQEKFSSIFYGLGSVPLSSIRSSIGTGNIYMYNPYYIIDKDGVKGDNPLAKAVNDAVTTNSGKKTTVNEKVQNILEITASKRKGNDFNNLIGDDWWGVGNYTGQSGKKAKELRKINSVYTWPHWQGAGNITEAEVQYITKLSSILTNDYNSVISMLLNNNKKSLGITSASPSQKLAFLNLAAEIAIHAEKASSAGSSTLSVNYDNLGKEGTNGIEVKAEFKVLSNDEFKNLGYNKINGLTAKDVVKVTIKNGDKEGDSAIAIWRYPRGYAAGQDLYNILVSRKGTGIFDKSKDYGGYLSKLDWSHLIYQAIFNFEVSGTDSTGAGDLYVQDDGLIGNMFASLINTIINGLTGVLGLYTLEELCLNTGGRGVSYWNGIFPTSWFSASQYFYLFTFTLAMLMLLIAMVRLAGQKAASTIGNVAKRISLLEGIKKIVICSICTMLFVPIFTVLVNLNNMIVMTLTKLIPAGASLNFTTGSLSGMGLAGAIVSIMLFWVTIKMNFTYILRAITILLCYILAPIAIMCSAVGDKFGQITSNWLKELLGNIFIQAVHALIMMVFITIAGSGSVAKIEKLVLIYSFVPLTEFVRTNLFALGKGLDQVAENLGQGIKDGATAATGAAFAGRMANKNNGANLQGKAGNLAGAAAANGNAKEGLSVGKVGSSIKTLGTGVKNAIAHPGQTINKAGASVGHGIANVATHPGKAAMGAAKIAGYHAKTAAKLGLHGAKAGIAAGGMLASGAMSSTGRMSHMATMYGARGVGSGMGAQFDDIADYFGGIADMQAANEFNQAYPVGRMEGGDIYSDDKGIQGIFLDDKDNNYCERNEEKALQTQDLIRVTGADGNQRWAITSNEAKATAKAGTTNAGKINGKVAVSNPAAKHLAKSPEFSKNIQDKVSLTGTKIQRQKEMDNLKFDAVQNQADYWSKRNSGFKINNNEKQSIK